MSARRRPVLSWALGIAAVALLTPQTAFAQAKPAATPTPPSQADKDKVTKESWDALLEEPKDKDVFRFDWDVPGSPALTLLGVEDGQIAKSNSLKPFILALPGLFASREGGQAVSLDIAPARLMYDVEDRSFTNYTGSKPLVFRTHFGIALYEGVDNTDPKKQKPSRLALGFSTSLLNDSDPVLATMPGQDRSAWEICFASAEKDVRAAMLPPTLSTELKALQDKYDAQYENPRFDPLIAKEAAGTLTTDEKNELTRLRAELAATGAEIYQGWDDWQTKVAPAFAKSAGGKAIQGCLQVADRAARMGRDLDLGGGAVWEGEPGRVAGLHDPAATFWASFRLPLGIGKFEKTDYKSMITWANENKSWFMLGGSGRAAFSEAIATGDAARPLIRANTYAGWLGVERNSEDSRFTAQIGFRRVDPRLATDSAFAGTRTVYQVAFDQRVQDGMWLSLSYGKASGAGALKSDSTARVSLLFDAPKLLKIFGN